MKIQKLTILLVTILTTSCYHPKTNNKLQFDTTDAITMAQKFAKIKNHSCGSLKNDSVATLIINYLNKLTPNISNQTFEIKNDTGYIIGKNIYVSINPDKPHKILLACNYDTYPTDTAQNCLSGAATVLAIAKCIAQNPNEYPAIDLIFFDGTEYWSENQNLNKIRRHCLGSQQWAKNADKHKYKCALYFYKPAHKGGVFAKEGHSNLFATKYLRILAEIENTLYKNNTLFTNDIAKPFNADNCFLNKDAKIPTVAICAHHTIINKDNEEEKTPVEDDSIENFDTTAIKHLGNIILQFCNQR